MPSRLRLRWLASHRHSARDLRVRGGKSMDEALAVYDWFSSDYVLTGPDVGPLCKSDYLGTQRGFTLNFGDAAPDLDYRLDGFHLDPANPMRVWFTLRYVGTHTGTTNIGKFNLPPTQKAIDDVIDLMYSEKLAANDTVELADRFCVVKEGLVDVTSGKARVASAAGLARVIRSGLAINNDDDAWAHVRQHEQRFLQALRQGSAAEGDDASC